MTGRSGKPHAGALPPPPSAARDSGANEVLRAWIVGTGLQVSLQPAFADPSTWGVLLADIARHVSRAYADQGAISEAEAFYKIKQLFDAEVATVTDPGQTERMQ